MNTRRFDARIAEFDAMRGFIEASAGPMGKEDQMRVILLVEELFANSVTHGYGGDCDKPVWLSMDVTSQACRVVYEDEAPEYDPFASPDRALRDGAIEDRPIGGLGIVLLTEMSSTHSYSRRGARNIIQFELPLGPGPGSATCV